MIIMPSAVDSVIDSLLSFKPTGANRLTSQRTALSSPGILTGSLDATGSDH